MRWVQAQDGPTIMRRGVHTVLTHVVNEVHAICEQIGGELLGQCPGPAAAQRSQRRTGQTGAGLEPSGPVKTSGVPGKTAGAA